MDSLACDPTSNSDPDVQAWLMAATVIFGVLYLMDTVVASVAVWQSGRLASVDPPQRAGVVGHTGGARRAGPGLNFARLPLDCKPP